MAALGLHGPRRRARRGAGTPARRGQAGASLIEVLIAVMLVGTVIAALAAGMLTMMGSTRATAEEQRLQAGLLSLTESLKASPYLPCGTPAAYEASHAAEPGHWDDHTAFDEVEIESVEYWVDSGDYGHYVADCPSPDGGRQRVTVRLGLRSSDREATATAVLSDRGVAP